MSKTDDLIEDVETLKIQVEGDKRNNDDGGLIESKNDHEARINTLEKGQKIASGMMLLAFIGTCTFFFSMLTEKNGDRNTDGNNIHSHGMGNNSELLRSRESNNSVNNK